MRSSIGIRVPDGYLNIEGCQLAWAANPPLVASPLAKPLQPILCLHDAGSGSREWQTLFDQPPAGCRIIVLDWPGHGHSSPLPETTQNLLELYAGVLHSILNQLAIPKAIFLGSGFGAAVATRYASLHSDAVLGLILAQPAGLIGSKTSRTRPLSACIPLLAKARPRTAQTVSEAIQAAQRQILRLEALKPEMLPLLDAAESALKQAQPSLRAELAALPQPVLFALSQDSRKFPLRSYLEVLDPLLARSPQHRITVFTGSVHPAWEEPQRFAQAVNGFAQSQLPFADHHHAWLLTAADYPAENMNLWKCVHPECSHEQALPAESNPNAT